MTNIVAIDTSRPDELSVIFEGKPPLYMKSSPAVKRARFDLIKHIALGAAGAAGRDGWPLSKEAYSGFLDLLTNPEKLDILSEDSELTSTTFRGYKLAPCISEMLNSANRRFKESVLEKFYTTDPETGEKIPGDDVDWPTPPIVKSMAESDKYTNVVKLAKILAQHHSSTMTRNLCMLLSSANDAVAVDYDDGKLLGMYALFPKDHKATSWSDPANLVTMDKGQVVYTWSNVPRAPEDMNLHRVEVKLADMVDLSGSTEWLAAAGTIREAIQVSK